MPLPLSFFSYSAFISTSLLHSHSLCVAVAAVASDARARFTFMLCLRCLSPIFGRQSCSLEFIQNNSILIDFGLRLMVSRYLLKKRRKNLQTNPNSNSTNIIKLYDYYCIYFVFAHTYIVLLFCDWNVCVAGSKWRIICTRLSWFLGLKKFAMVSFIMAIGQRFIGNGNDDDGSHHKYNHYRNGK